MKLGLTELRRTPGRFLPVTVAMTLLVVLLTVLGGFLDGLELSQTGSYRAQVDRGWAFSEASELQVGRSLVDTDTRNALAALPGVEAVGRLSQLATTASTESANTDPANTDPDAVRDVVFIGYDLGSQTLPDPPADGVVVDKALRDFVAVEVGDTLLIGPNAEPVVVAAFVDDVSQGSPTVWAATDTWRRIASGFSTNLPPEGMSQVVILETTGGGVDGVAAAPVGVQIADTPGVIDALATVQQQSSTFAGIIGVTFLVTLIVVALFFALLTLERVKQYAVLKAIGASSRDLLAGLATQAITISAVAVAVGVAISFVFVGLLPPELPLRIETNRLVFIAVGTLATALAGSLLTFRRITRIDPAEAIG